MKEHWYWFMLLIPIGIIVFVALDAPKVISYEEALLEYDKGLNSYFVILDGQETDVPWFEEEVELEAGMKVYCLTASESNIIKIPKVYISLTDVDPDKWIKEIYPDAGEGKGGVIFIWILAFLIALMVFCLAPKKMMVIHADND